MSKFRKQLYRLRGCLAEEEVILEKKKQSPRRDWGIWGDEEEEDKARAERKRLRRKREKQMVEEMDPVPELFPFGNTCFL